MECVRHSVNRDVAMEIYVRIKRKKTTYFIQLQPSETILEVKQKIEEYSSKPAAELQILRQRSGGWRVMDDALRVQEAGIRNEEILALAYRNADGSFEAVEITPYEVEMAT